MKKILSILTLLVAFAVQGVADRTIYLSPGVWNVDGARFAVWAWPNTGEGQWVDAVLAPNETSIYQVTLSDDIANIIWVRMNGATTENNWDNKWNQTDDIALGNENLYTITGWGEGGSPYSKGTYTIATINTVQLQGNFASTGKDWNAIDLSAVAGEENTWSGTLDLTDFTDDKEFKLVINGGDDGSKTYAGWIGTNKMTVYAPNGWVLATGESANANCTLYNSTTGYKTYKITATWVPNSNYAANWTLKIEGIDERVVAPTHTYTVAGTPAVLFGAEWDATLEDNDMVESATESGVYTWTKENVVLDGTTAIKFRVCQDHALDVAYPSGNFDVNAGHGYTGAGTYNVTISFNSNTQTVTPPVFTLQAAQDAQITSVAIKGAYASDTEWANAKTLPLTGSENVYTSPVALDFTTTLEDFVFGLVINGTFVNFTQVTIDPASASLLVDDGTDHHNILFKNSTSGYQTYTATATWTPGPDATAGWTLKVTGVDPRVLEYYLVGELTGGWPENNEDQTKDVQMTKQTNGLYTYEVASFAAEAQKYEYKLRANKIWGLYELPSSGNADYTFAEPGNYKLTFTANVTGEPIGDVAAYTLKLDVKRILNTYTATFDNAANWEHVYAYTWTDGDPKVEQLGAWPGTEITKSGDVYTVSIEAAEAPAKIVFNDGSAESVVGVNQTADFTFVDGQAYVFTTLPGVPIWTSTEATKVDWEQGRFVALDASTFADAKVGDILHISIENPTINTEDEWVGQVALQDREKWTNLEGGKPIGSGTVSDAAFVITGDILARMQSVGLVVTGINYETSLITLEKDVFTGSAKTIWVGNATGNIAIDKAHFANSNNFTGVKVGDVIRVTFAGMDTGENANNWCGINYNNASYKWSDFESGDFLDRNDYTKPVVDFVINSESAVAILNETNTGVIINTPTRTALQVELISFTGYYLATNESDWKTFTTMTEEAGKYTATVSGAGTYFAIVPNTAMTIDEDAIATWKSVIRPNSTNDFVVDFANYSDVTKVDGDKVWQIGATNDADVTINYTPADGKFAISCQKEVEITDGYATYSNAQMYTVEGATANFVTVNSEFTEATLVPQAEGAILPASGVNTLATGKGIVLSGSGPAIIKSVDLKATAVDATGNMLTGTGDYTFNLNADKYTAYLLQTVNGQTGFQKWNGDTTTPLAAHKAFLAIPNVTAGAPAFISFGGGTTGIEAVTQSQRTGQYYTLDGRRVENPTKGLYIINGKKVVIK